MINAHSWNELRSQEALREVPPVRALRPNSDDFFHYVEGGQERVAVPTTKPYGELTDISFTRSNEVGAGHLLRGVRRAVDYSVLDVPVDTIGLKAASLGNGAGRVELLQPAYENAGKAVADMAKRTRVPVLGLSGEIIFVPPLKFGESDTGTPQVIDGLVSSLRAELSSVFQTSRLLSLEQSLRRGFEG